MVKKQWQYVKPFSSNTGTSQTDGQTDRRAIVIGWAAESTQWRYLMMTMSKMVTIRYATNVHLEAKFLLWQQSEPLQAHYRGCVTTKFPWVHKFSRQKKIPGLFHDFCIFSDISETILECRLFQLSWFSRKGFPCQFSIFRKCLMYVTPWDMIWILCLILRNHYWLQIAINQNTDRW